jgi:hypothetical protein
MPQINLRMILNLTRTFAPANRGLLWLSTTAMLWRTVVDCYAATLHLCISAFQQLCILLVPRSQPPATSGGTATFVARNLLHRCVSA